VAALIFAIDGWQRFGQSAQRRSVYEDKDLAAV
jgi:hypothetical protein